MNHIPLAPRGPSRRILAVALAAFLVTRAALGQGPTPFATQQPPQNAGSPLAAPSPSAGVQVHSIVGANAKGVAAKLKQIYAGYPGLSINDAANNQIIVQGPPAAQQEVARWLSTEGLVATSAPPRLAPGQPGIPMQAGERGQPVQPVAFNEPQRGVTRTWQLKHLGAKDFEAKLAKTWGAALQSSQDPVGEIATFRFPPTAAGTTSIVVDRRANTATITAPKSSAGSWERLVTVLDSRPTRPGEQTAIMPLIKSDPDTIRRAAALLMQYFSTPADPHRKQHIGQFVSMLFQAERGQAGGGAQPAAPPPPAPAAAGPAPGVETAAQPLSAGSPSIASMEAIARINNVQIEILDDVIVVRGRKEDVDRVLQIIEQIEQQSLQFKPEIEIYYLKHVDSFALTEMINLVAPQAFARQGTVTVQPLQRPNAVLLIGRKENIPSLIELIAKLDQPAPSDAERKIFHLENMSAIDAERTIRNFFVNRPPTDTTYRAGLGTRALVIADYRSNSLIVQAAPRDMIEITRLIAELDVATSTVGYEVKVFKLRNSIAETLAPVLEEALTATQAATTATAAVGAAGQATPARATPPAVSLQFERLGPDGVQLIKSGIMANVRVNADTRTNSLIVTGPATAMGLMAALIEQLDTLPVSVARIKVFTIRNGDATALAEMLTNLFGQPQQANQQAPGQVSPTGQGESAIVPLRFSVDQRTNSIIATGNEGDLNVIYHILTRLDEGDIRQRETKVYRLRNAPAADVSNALTQMLAQQIALVQSAPELITPVEQIEQQVIVVPEVVTNSLIISATTRQLARINNILETLDRRPPMVVIQVVLAEVTLTDDDAFGVEWGLQDALMFDRSSSAAANRFNFNSNPLTLPNDSTAASLATATKVATQAVSNLATGRTDLTQGFGGLVLTASSESVSVLLRALERSQRSQIISRPQVQTMDNQTAFVQVGAKVPRIIGATNTGLTVTPIINDINVGIIMQVTPRVSPDGAIVMQIYTEKSTVGPDATGIPIAVDANGNAIRSPQIPITTAQTIVLARTGQTVILGGLITKDLEEDTHRVPYLADIPVIGRLFRYDQVHNKRTELLIILTPYLVTSTEQIDWINAREGQRMSWCLADLVNIHGPVPFSGSPLFNPSPTPVIYPDLQPNGYPEGPEPYGTQPTFSVPGSSPHPFGPANLPTEYPAGTPPYGTPPGPTPPAAFPPGPMPYGDPAVRPPPVPAVPPPPPPGPGLGSSRRTNDGIVIPQPASLMPPTIQPTTPPVGTGVNSAANWQPYPPPMQPPAMQPLSPQMVPLPVPSGVAPAGYQQAMTR